MCNLRHLMGTAVFLICLSPALVMAEEPAAAANADTPTAVAEQNSSGSQVPVDAAAPMPAPDTLLPSDVAPVGGSSAVISPKSSAIAHEIADINERLAVLSAQLAELDMKAKIAAKLSELDQAGMHGIGAGNADGAGMPLARDGDLPAIIGIDGIDGKLQAVVSLGGGASQKVQIGDRISGWMIKDIQLDSVTAMRGDRTEKLPFAAYTPSVTLPASIPTPSAPVAAPAAPVEGTAPATE